MITTRKSIPGFFAGLALWPLGGSAACKVSATPELPIIMSGTQPMIAAKINGADVRFILDSGAFYSMISSATAAQFKLPSRHAPFNFYVTGVGGTTNVDIARVKEFTLAGYPLHDIEFLAGGSESGNGSAGILGQNFLERWDVEYDLARGVIRLLKVDDCKHANLAYWSKPGDSISLMDINSTTPLEPHTVGAAFINGTKIRVMFDTGSWASMISLKAAARAGVTPQTAGVVKAGYQSGIGRHYVETFVAPFASFKIGDGEEIKNARLRFGDIDLADADMLIGADFFLSHRIYVANSQHRLYMTYNGGPVFNLKTSLAGAVSGEAEDSSKTEGQPADAAAFFRRGAASAGRRDFDNAIADLSRAIELNPNEPEYFHQRGMAYWESKQPEPAMADFNRSLKLNADYLPALVSRAELRLQMKDQSGASADLDAADRRAPKQADIRFELARLYERVDLPESAAAQFDLWIANHPDDAKMAGALNGRCWVHALLGTDLPKALSDCNSALGRASKGDPLSARILNSRGLVQLRLGAYDKSISDYDASLKGRAENASALYGRGIAKLRKKQTAEGNADIAEAAKISPKIADEFGRRGIVP